MTFSLKTTRRVALGCAAAAGVMAAAAGGMVFINGLGAVAGPVVTGWLMGRFGPWAFFLVIAVLSFAVTAYAGWRMTRRPAPSVAETDRLTMVSMAASPVAVNLAADQDSDGAQKAAGRG